MADRPHRAIVIHGDGLLREPQAQGGGGVDSLSRASCPNLHLLARNGSSGFVALRQPPPVQGELSRVESELLQLLDLYDADQASGHARGLQMVPGSTTLQSNTQSPSLAQRFMGLEAAFLSDTDAALKVAGRAGFRCCSLSQLPTLNVPDLVGPTWVARQQQQLLAAVASRAAKGKADAAQQKAEAAKRAAQAAQQTAENAQRMGEAAQRTAEQALEVTRKSNPGPAATASKAAEAAAAEAKKAAEVAAAAAKQAEESAAEARAASAEATAAEAEAKAQAQLAAAASSGGGKGSEGGDGAMALMGTEDTFSVTNLDARLVAQKLIQLLGLDKPEDAAGAAPPAAGQRVEGEVELVWLHVHVARTEGAEGFARSVKAVEWIDRLVQALTGLAAGMPGARASAHMYTVVAVGYAAQDVALGETTGAPVLPRGNTPAGPAGVIRPTQSFEVKGNTPVQGLRYHHPMIATRYLRGVTRCDNAQRFAVDECAKNGGDGAILADRFLYEIAFKLWRYPKYGA